MTFLFADVPLKLSTIAFR